MRMDARFAPTAALAILPSTCASMDLSTLRCPLPTAPNADLMTNRFNPDTIELARGLWLNRGVFIP
jgi:hypothetical protein